MTIKTKDFTRVTYVCDVCERTSPPNDIENGHYSAVPSGWKQFGIGRFPKTFCPHCCARHVPNYPVGFTIGRVIDAIREIDQGDVATFRIPGPAEEKQAC
jgi:hypothetical protein